MNESPEAIGSNFDKKMINQKVDDAVGEMFDRYGNEIPENIQTLGEEIRDMVSDVSRRSSVNTRVDFIEALDFSKNGGNLSEEAYYFIIDNL